MDGERLEVLRGTDGTIRVRTNNVIESAEELEWYDRWLNEPPPKESAVSAFWGAAMVRHDLGVPAVTGSRRPVVDSEGEVVGVVAVEVSLVDVSRFMASLKIGNSGECFVVDSQGHLIAVADSTSFF